MSEDTKKRRLHGLIAAINFGWAMWAIVGGLWFVFAHDEISQNTFWGLFVDNEHDLPIVGISLLICGVVSLVGVCKKSLARLAAILCAAWCLTMAVILQLATPQFDQGDIDAWLLLICAFTCVMRWALLVLEPYIDR